MILWGFKVVSALINSAGPGGVGEGRLQYEWLSLAE